MSQPKFCAYESALMATEDFLRRVGVRNWADWLKQDLIEWRTTRGVSHHRSAYGGMGSFNDVVICPMNDNNITSEQEPWANSLFEWLKATLFYLSQNPSETITEENLRVAVGRNAPSLAAFVGGERAPDSMRGFAGGPVKISGWRCLTCGYAEITQFDIDNAIADEFVPGMIFQACADGSSATCRKPAASISLVKTSWPARTWLMTKSELTPSRR